VDEGRPRRGAELIAAAERSETTMKTTWIRTLLPAALLLILVVPAAAGKAPADLLGLYPGMSDSDAQHRLEKLGEVVRGQDMAKQTWRLRDPRYGYLVLRYDESWRIHWITVFAREAGRRVRYRDLGDLSLAKHTGHHFYDWTIPARPGSGTWSLVARGTDPKYLDSISISRTMRQDLIVPAHAESNAEVD
jgi:hypothetical protein